jgi:hypothetical protein
VHRQKLVFLKKCKWRKQRREYKGIFYMRRLSRKTGIPIPFSGRYRPRKHYIPGVVSAKVAAEFIRAGGNIKAGHRKKNQEQYNSPVLLQERL